MVSPSRDGTSMTSLISWVLTDIRATRARGFTTLRPDFSVWGETLPKRSTTPTWPAGTTARQRVSAKRASRRATAPNPVAAGRLAPRVTRQPRTIRTAASTETTNSIEAPFPSHPPARRAPASGRYPKSR
jgi:hypothetical protein